jgi:hypothetical protein
MNGQQPQVDLNQIIANAVTQQISNPALLGSIVALSLRQAGASLTAASWAGSIDANAFLTPIKKLKPISLALFNQWMVSPLAWRLLAQKKEDGEYVLNVFQVNEGNLAASTVSDLLQGEEALEQRAELIRQLEAIGHTGTKIYTALAIEGDIEGYQYWTDVDTGGVQDAKIVSETNVGSLQDPAPAVKAEHAEVAQPTEA